MARFLLGFVLIAACSISLPGCGDTTDRPVIEDPAPVTETEVQPVDDDVTTP